MTTTNMMKRAERPWGRGRAVMGRVALAVLATWSAAAGATVLTFDQGRDGAPVEQANNGGAIPASYGDRVNAATVPTVGGAFTYGNGGEGFTPNVVVDLFTDGATPADSRMRLWRQGYGDLVNVVFGEGPGVGGASQIFVRLQADPGFSVDLYGFDLAGFGRDYTIAGIDVMADANTLFEVDNLLVEGDAQGAGHTHVGFSTPWSASTLLIRLDLSNLAPGVRDNIGLDALRFGQSPPPQIGLPEPETWWLLAATLPALAWRRRVPRGARPASTGARR